MAATKGTSNTTLAGQGRSLYNVVTVYRYSHEVMSLLSIQANMLGRIAKNCQQYRSTDIQYTQLKEYLLKQVIKQVHT